MHLEIVVQGPKSVDHVLERIEVFLETVRTEIEEMPLEEFVKQVSGVISELEMKPKTLTDRFDLFWDEIESRQYDFADQENEVKVLISIKKKDVLAFYDRYVNFVRLQIERKIRKDAPERRKLAILVHPKNEDQEKIEEIIKKNAEMGRKEKEIKDVDELRQFLPFYGFPIPAIDLKPIGIDPLEHKEPSIPEPE
ncbi:hypothetical protein B9Z55_017270 [Caenorhabditis nigoni]|uniref:Coenzyme PQQ synthesis protein F-like C-terminal lobe domain-containing protein n=1 Tax=Caenorhabditis nigoni TaxID=1611254 RepID=A0A2G5T949_9PELO|nr:hypothetical protein B9Z55_017270 [Caenorhabditis nigoni]